MKTNIKIFFAAALAALTVGCTDLDVPVESQYTSYPNNEAALEAQLSGIYFQMRDCFGRRYMEGLALSSDEYTAVSYGGNWYDNGAYAHPSLHSFTYEDASIDWMTVLASGVVKANEVIDSDADDSYKAPARAMRAFFTFIMMDCWGDVAINDFKLSGEIDLEKRQPRAEVARWIESELKEIIPQLTTETTGENYGKPNKYMAQALLAKLYINWPVYTASSVEAYDANSYSGEKLADCIAVCDEIIKSGKFALGPDPYRFKFASDNTERVQNGTIKDFIYAMPYHTTQAVGMQYGRSHSYKDIKNLNPSYYGEALTNSGGGYVTMTPEFVKLFNLKGDERNLLILGLSENLDDYRYGTGGDENTVYVYDPNTLLPTKEVCNDKEGNPLKLSRNINLVEKDFTINVGDNLTGWRQGCRNLKWHVTRADFANGRNQSNDIPLLRYADVLLMKAEALVRQGKASEATALVNQIRSYVNAEQLDHSPSLNDIYEERGREFFDENMRRADMIRFGHFEDEYFPHYKDFPTANFDKTRRVFPINKSMLDLNPKWTQNNGY
ncbi:MAG: RagB/SusD family nutrient uptake outer membrane protein [Prevotella sp.]|nr:RagB/SusD family nutrient uptake outer membrane protein [Prevotella sp.]